MPPALRFSVPPWLSLLRGCIIEYMKWRKSSYSGRSNCVEAGHAPGVVAVRDSHPGGAGIVLEFTPDTWTRFLKGADICGLCKNPRPCGCLLWHD